MDRVGGRRELINSRMRPSNAAGVTSETCQKRTSATIQFLVGGTIKSE
jgi:hypothetical protein